MKTLKKMKRKVVITKRLFQSDVKKNLLMNLRGFKSDRVYTYPDFRKNRKLFIKDYDRHAMFSINNNNQQLFSQLNSFLIFKNFINYAKVFGFVQNKEFISLENGTLTLEDILNLDNFVFKPIESGKGVEVYVISKIEEDFYKLNNQTLNKDELFSFILSRDNYLLQEYIMQHELISHLYPKSANTVRITTMRNPKNNYIFIGWIVLRIGNDSTAPVDNYSAGGISILVNSDTGKTLQARMIDRENKLILKLNTHINTNAELLNLTVPNLSLIKNDVVEAHKKHPGINFIAWDVIVTNDGYKVIELNNTTGFNHIQVHYPLLNDKRIKDFFEYYRKKY